MTWTDIYPCCLIIGVGLSAISFLFGSIDLSHFHIGHGDLGPSDLSPGCFTGASLFQFGTFAGFFSWFGAAGHILGRLAYFAWWTTLLLALVAGVTGSAFLLGFVRKVLLAHDPTLDPSEYRLIGALGTVSAAIRERGTGEVLISRASARHWTAARSADGTPLGEGTVVVVLEYEEGVASVTRWDDA